jgi:hypothetical protein
MNLDKQTLRTEDIYTLPIHTSPALCMLIAFDSPAHEDEQTGNRESQMF